MQLPNKTNQCGGRNIRRKVETNEETYEVWQWTICLSIRAKKVDEKGVNVSIQTP